MKAIYLKLFIESPQPHVSFCLVLKFLESYKILNPQNIQQKKFLTHEIALRKKIWTHGTPTWKYFEPSKYPRENILDPQNTHKKLFWTHEIPTRKFFGPTNYPWENTLNPRNTHENIFCTYEIPTRKCFGPTKAQWHESHDNARQTKFNTLVDCIYNSRSFKIA